MQRFTIIDQDELKSILSEVVAENFKQFLANGTQAQQDEPDARLTKKQAAALINCSVSTIDNARRAGKIKAYRIGRKSVRFDRADILNLAKQ